MRFTTVESEEGLSGRGGGEEDELDVVVWGFAVEVDDAPVAGLRFLQRLSNFCNDF